MPDHAGLLDRRAVDLLYSIIETPEATIAASIIDDYYDDLAPVLKGSGLLEPNDHQRAATSLADHDDEPINLSWNPDGRNFGYFSPSAGWVPIPDARLTVLQLNFRSLLDLLLGELDGAAAWTPVPLLPDLLWEVGDVRLPGHPKRVPLWIGRRLSVPSVWSSFVDTVGARPAPGFRIVLSLTPISRLPEQVFRGHSIIAVRDLADQGGLVVDPDLLAARVASGPPNNGSMSMAADGASITVHGKRYAFPGSKQRGVIRHLHGAWQSGNPECLTAEVLEAAGYSASVNTLAKAFSGREDWRDFIMEEHGRCWMFS